LAKLAIAENERSGQDIEAHGNDPDQVIRCVRNWLSEHRSHNASPLPGAAAIQADYRLFQAEVGALLAPRRLDSNDLTHNDFLWAVNDWIAARAPSDASIAIPAALAN